MTKGRTVPPQKVETWTSTDTGYVLPIRKVSTLLRAEVRRQVLKLPEFREPDPPYTKVDYGDGEIRTPHRGHPVYQQLILDWQGQVAEEVGKRLKRVALERGVILQDADVDAAAVAEVRGQLAAEGIDTSEYDDRYVFLAFVCIGSEEDWKDLLRAIFERSAPQEAAIQSHIATFPPAV